MNIYEALCVYASIKEHDRRRKRSIRDSNAFQEALAMINGQADQVIAGMPMSADEQIVAKGNSASYHRGIDFALTCLCEVLSVKVENVMWDAATETIDGDVKSVIRGILEKYSETLKGGT